MFLDDLEIVGIFVSLEFASEQHDFFKLFPKSGRQKKRSFYGQADRKQMWKIFGPIFPIIKW